MAKPPVVDMEFFKKQYHEFRAVMCDPTISIEEKQDEYEEFLHVYILVDTKTKEEKEFIITMVQALQSEFSRRMALQLVAEFGGRDD